MKSLLKDKNVLRVVSLIAVLNMLGYLIIRDLDAVAFFAIVGFLASYFSKNMIVVLLVAMVATNMLTVSRTFRVIHESFKGSNGKGKGQKATKKVSDPAVEPADEEEDQEMGSGRPGNLDKAATVEETYDNLDKVLSDGKIEAMAKRTQNLAAQQQNLHEQLKTLTPAIKDSMALLDKIGGAEGMEGMIGKVSGMMEKFAPLLGNKN
jgi:NADH:ubiquinone oxidoreductase subunit 5 (subunit L)/multisubunit Na+/H+ antiporter MnhA subunit